jgi:hypothetical protein
MVLLATTAVVTTIVVVIQPSLLQKILELADCHYLYFTTIALEAIHFHHLGHCSGN